MKAKLVLCELLYYDNTEATIPDSSLWIFYIKDLEDNVLDRHWGEGTFKNPFAFDTPDMAERHFFNFFNSHHKYDIIEVSYDEERVDVI